MEYADTRHPLATSRAIGFTRGARRTGGVRRATFNDGARLVPQRGDGIPVGEPSARCGVNHLTLAVLLQRAEGLYRSEYRKQDVREVTEGLARDIATCITASKLLVTRFPILRQPLSRAQQLLGMGLPDSSQSTTALVYMKLLAAGVQELHSTVDSIAGRPQRRR